MVAPCVEYEPLPVNAKVDPVRRGEGEGFGKVGLQARLSVVRDDYDQLERRRVARDEL